MSIRSIQFSRIGIASVLSACLLFSATVSATSAPDIPMVAVGGCEDSKPQTEPEILARRLLRETSGDLFFESHQIAGLAEQIATVLHLIRIEYPETADIAARPRFASELIVQMEPALFDIVSAAFEAGSMPVALKTGYSQFDELNRLTRLSRMKLLDHAAMAILCLDIGVDIAAAANRYNDAQGIEFAEPSTMIGDGSDVFIHKAGDIWRIAVSHRWGDCPSGCISRKDRYFIVSEHGIRQVNAAERAANSELWNFAE